jgi:hypothetical protein
MSKFITELVKLLRERWQANIMPLATMQIVVDAAAACLDDVPLTVRLRREVSPEISERQVYTIIESDGSQLMLSADEVATLRLLLLTWDENLLRPGTPYITRVIMEDGRIELEWQPEHDG